MKKLSELEDKRINSKNFLIEMTIQEYLQFAEVILKNNPFQRKRIAKKVYSLLKDDLKKGCIIPPIVLALTNQADSFNGLNDDEILDFMVDKKESIVVLDGLQRTYTIMDIVNEQENNNEFLEHSIRFELYVGINRIGILYRMLTLNTAQTPMSLRHQIEILYSNFSDSISNNGDIELLKESDEKRAYNKNQYNFKDIVDGFNSYIERNELAITRDDILENLQSLEKLADENNEDDIFKDFLETFHALVCKLDEITKHLDISVSSNEKLGIDSNDLFGKSSLKIFKKSQAITGFGAAIGTLKDFEIIAKISDINKTIDKIHTIEEPEEFIIAINKELLKIKNEAPKIGNAQRIFFKFFFRDLLNKENEDSYLQPIKAVKSAYHKYDSQAR
jgi:soluble cytochrome b562